MSPSSSGSGRLLLKQKAGVQIPVGTQLAIPSGAVVQWEDAASAAQQYGFESRQLHPRSSRGVCHALDEFARESLRVEVDVRKVHFLPRNALLEESLVGP